MNAFVFFRTSTRTALLLLLGCSILTTASAQSADSEDPVIQFETLERKLADPSVRDKLTVEQWDTYAVQITRALDSGHDGVRQGALRMIIQYGDYLQLGRRAVYDVVRIYRSHPNDNMRRMAVVALGKMHDAWGIDYLKRSLPFEKNPQIRHTLLSVLEAHGVVRLGPAKVTG